MAQTSGFFEAEWDPELYNEETQTLGDWDRKYLAEQFARYFSKFVSTGVMNDVENQLKVSAGTGLNVVVSPGFAFINGFWYYNSEQLVLAVPANETPSTRVDSVRVRWNASNREIEVVYITDDIINVRSDLYYDLQVAQVSVPASASMVIDSNITDVRANVDLCGLINLIKAEDIGDLDNLQTTVKSTIVGAINSVVGSIGDLEALRTTNKESIVKAINYIVGIIGDMSTLESEVKNTLVNAINSIKWDTIMSKPFERIDANTLGTKLVDGKATLVVNHSADDFVIASQKFVFTNLQCRINDNRITADSLADVYFTSASINYAQKAKISVETYAGYLIMTAVNAPTGNIYGMIKVRVV